MSKQPEITIPSVKVINQKIRRVGGRFGVGSLPYKQLIADLSRDFRGQTHLTKDGILQINTGKNVSYNQYQGQTLLKVSRRAGVREITKKAKERLKEKGITKPTRDEITEDVTKFTEIQEKFDKALDLIYDHEIAGDLPVDINAAYQKIYRHGKGAGMGVTTDDVEFINNSIYEFDKIRDDLTSYMQSIYVFRDVHNATNPDNKYFIPETLMNDNENIVNGEYTMDKVRETVDRIQEYLDSIRNATDPNLIEY